MQNKPDNRVYAGFFVRLAAYLVDLLIVGAMLLVFRIPLWISSFASPDNFMLKDFIFKYSVADILLYVLKVTYFILLTYFTGSTLGKKLFQIRVVSADERRMTFFEVAFRETVGRFLSSVILSIGYIMAGIDKQKRGLHDLLSDTNVVYYHERKVYVHSPVYYKNMAPVPNSQMQMNQPMQFNQPAQNVQPNESAEPKQSVEPNKFVQKEQNDKSNKEIL